MKDIAVCVTAGATRQAFFGPRDPEIVAAAKHGTIVRLRRPRQAPVAHVNHSNTDIGRVVMWMTGALLSFSAGAVSVRELARSITVFDILSFRSATGLLFLVTLAVV